MPFSSRENSALDCFEHAVAFLRIQRDTVICKSPQRRFNRIYNERRHPARLTDRSPVVSQASRIRSKLRAQEGILCTSLSLHVGIARSNRVERATRWDIFWPRTLQGFALGFLFVPLTTAALSGISRAAMGNATGLDTLVRQLGGSFGIAILQVIQQRDQATAYANLASAVTLANPAVNAMVGTNVNPSKVSEIMAMVQINADAISYNDLFRFCGIIFILAIPTVFLLNGKDTGSGGAPVVHLE